MIPNEVEAVDEHTLPEGTPPKKAGYPVERTPMPNQRTPMPNQRHGRGMAIRAAENEILRRSNSHLQSHSYCNADDMRMLTRPI